MPWTVCSGASHAADEGSLRLSAQRLQRALRLRVFSFDSVRRLPLYVQCAPPVTLGFLLYHTLYIVCVHRMMHDLSLPYHRTSQTFLTYLLTHST